MKLFARYGKQAGLDIWYGLEGGLRRLGSSPLWLLVLFAGAALEWLLVILAR